MTNFFPTLFAHPAVQALTWWGFADLAAWQGAAAGFWRKDMTIKLVFVQHQASIKGACWTKTEGRANGNGGYRTRSSFGTQRLTTQIPGGCTVTKDALWAHGSTHPFERGVSSAGSRG